MTSPDPAWDVGEPYLFPLEYRDAAGVLVNPTTIVATVKLPDATIADLSTSVVRGTVGRATATWMAIVSGRHIFRFVAAGPGAKVDERTLYAQAPYGPPGNETTNFATVAELGTFLQSDVDLPAAELALSLASGTIRAASGQHFTAVTADTVTLAGGGRLLVLPQQPVNAVTAVTFTPWWNGTVTAATVGQWVQVGGRLRWLGWGCWPEWVTVTYSHGYTTVPDDVKAVCLQLAADRYTNPEGLDSEQIDDYMYRRSGRVGTASVAEDDLSALIRRYRIRPLSVSTSR